MPCLQHPDELKLNETLMMQKEKMAFICECNKVCKSLGGLNLHKKKCKGVPISLDFQCDECQRYFKSSNGLRLHQKTCGVESEGYPCKCGKICKSNSGLTLHKKKCDGHPKTKSSSEPQSCEKCGKVCKNLNGLKLHEKHCGNTNEIECQKTDTCKKAPEPEPEPEESMSDDEGEENQCEHCNLIFPPEEFHEHKKACLQKSLNRLKTRSKKL